MKFFSEVYAKQKGEICRYAAALDWFFDEDKFVTNWNQTKTGQLTKRLKKRLPLLACKNGYEYKNIEKFADYESSRQPIIQHKSRDSEGKDFIRHIRNGIAHGKVCIKNQKSEYYILLKDFNKYKIQTAYMFMPLEYLLIIHKEYKSILAQQNNHKRKTKK